jgi:thiamine biosynthesis protein ThiC
MKNVMFFYNGVQSEEELHDDEVADKLGKDQLMERAGKYWKIVEVQKDIIASDPVRIDVVKVFLAGPESRAKKHRIAKD